MKKLISYPLVFFIILSCSDESQNQENVPDPVACFTLAENTINYLGTIEIEDCSTNAINYDYFLNGQPILLNDLLQMRHETRNQNQISLTVTDQNGTTDTFSLDFFVRPETETFYYPTDLADMFSLLDFGINPVLDRMYAIVKNIIDGDYFYVDIDEELSLTFIPIENFTSNVGVDIALTSFNSDGTVYIDIPYFTASSGSRATFKVNPVTGESSDPIGLASLDYDVQYVQINDQEYSLGSKSASNDDGRIYVPSFNLRNQNSTSYFREYDFQGKSGILGNIIPYKQGFLAYATSYDLLTGPENFGYSNAKTLLLELDLNFELVNTTELPELGENNFTSVAALTGPFHMQPLPNNGIVLYGLGSFRILDENLTIITSETFSTNAIQSLYVDNEAIYLSESDYIKKYDFEGNLINKFEYGQFSVTSIIPYKGDLLFMSAVRSSTTGEPNLFSLFFGRFDKDMNVKDVLQ